MLIDKLRERTKNTHEALEQTMFPFIKHTHDVATYANLLRLFYGYYKPLEMAVDAQIDTNTFPDYGKLRKTKWMLEDLALLNQPVADIPLCKLGFSIASHASAMGALYVTEGSTLGGKIICKTIANNLKIDNLIGLKFFNGYGNETANRWKTFMAALNNYSDTPAEKDVLETANNVFIGFKQWII